LSILLVGAGGHAKGVVEVLTLCSQSIAAYADPIKADWLDASWCQDVPTWTKLNGHDRFVMGIGGVAPDKLQKRLAIFDDICDQGLSPVTAIHPRANVSADADIQDGAIIMTGAIVQPGAIIGRGAIINTGAIIEHDSVVGAGSHVAPGAIVLGQCHIGDACMVGAGAVVLQGNTVEMGTLVKAVSRYPK